MVDVGLEVPQLQGFSGCFGLSGASINTILLTGPRDLLSKVISSLRECRFWAIVGNKNIIAMSTLLILPTY